jgi:hypothetical protein
MADTNHLTSQILLLGCLPTVTLQRVLEEMNQGSVLKRVFFKKGLKRNLNSKKGAGLGNFEKWAPPAQ